MESPRGRWRRAPGRVAACYPAAAGQRKITVSLAPDLR